MQEQLNITTDNEFFTCKVSSVLNKSTKQFGKQNMFDGSDETCWNSHQGSPQWIVIEFKSQVEVDNINIMFQGGFAGKECEVHFESENNWKLISPFFPKDDNSLQSIETKLENGKSPTTSKLKIIFSSSTDFYGRITVYKLEVLGRKL